MSMRRVIPVLIASALSLSLIGCGTSSGPMASAPTSFLTNLPGFEIDAKSMGAVRVKGQIGEVVLGLLPDGKIPGNTPQYEKLQGQSIQAQALPKKVDLRKYCEPVRNQGNLGSCTAFSSTGLLEFYYNKKGVKAPRFSPLYVYYMERAIMEAGQTARGEKSKAISQDTGASSYLAVYTLTNYGAAPESAMPYQDGKEALKIAPSEKALKEAQKYRPEGFAQIKTIQGMKKALANGHAFILGMHVTESFMTSIVAREGRMLTLGDRERSFGGHSVMAVGYDDEKEAFIIRNSWGEGWGQDGYFEMPYDFIKPGKIYSCFTIL